VPTETVPGDDWFELVGSSLEDDYTFVVGDRAPIYLAVGDRPTGPVDGIPIGTGAMYSAEINRGDEVWVRSQTDKPASVRAVPGIRVDSSTERAVTVQASLRANTYDRGGDFDTGDADTFPISINPEERVEQVLLPIVEGEVDVELTTVDGDVVTLPVAKEAAIDSYSCNSVQITDPSGSAPRVAGGWAGE